MQDIKPSCLVGEPVSIQLLELNRSLHTLLHSKQHAIDMVEYLAPVFERNITVMGLIKELE